MPLEFGMGEEGASSPSAPLGGNGNKRKCSRKPSAPLPRFKEAGSALMANMSNSLRKGGPPRAEAGIAVVDGVLAASDH